MDPALRSFDPAHLDTGQSLIQLLGDRSHLGHAAGQADLFTVVNDLANRGDYCCGTAQTSLCEVFYFIQVYFSLFYFQSQILLGNIYQRTTGDGRKDTVGLGSYDLVVLGNEQEVRTAGLLYLGTGSSIQVHILIVAFLVSGYDSM